MTSPGGYELVVSGLVMDEGCGPILKKVTPEQPSDVSERLDDSFALARIGLAVWRMKPIGGLKTSCPETRLAGWRA